MVGIAVACEASINKQPLVMLLSHWTVPQWAPPTSSQLPMSDLWWFCSAIGQNRVGPTHGKQASKNSLAMLLSHWTVLQGAPPTGQQLSFSDLPLVRAFIQRCVDWWSSGGQRAQTRVLAFPRGPSRSPSLGPAGEPGAPREQAVGFDLGGGGFPGCLPRPPTGWTRGFRPR